MAKTPPSRKHRSSQPPSRRSASKANSKSKLLRTPIPSPNPKKLTRWRRSNPPARQLAKLPPVWQVTKIASNIIWQYRRTFLVIIVAYGVLEIIMVHGFSGGTNVSNLKNSFGQAFNAHYGGLFSSLSIFITLLGSAGSSSSTTGSSGYQAVLLLIVSLALIWTLRQSFAGVQVRGRDAYYRGLYPLVPFVLILLVIGLQLLPLVIGTALYSIVSTNGIAVHAIEKFFWGLLTFGLSLVSLYMVTSSIFALYVVTLPDMTPLKALRSARELVRGRRLVVFRKVLFLPALLFIVAALIMLPAILLLAPAAAWIFFVLTLLALLAVHGYMYALYRELLRE